jgi:hypothetical protein
MKKDEYFDSLKITTRKGQKSNVFVPIFNGNVSSDSNPGAADR